MTGRGAPGIQANRGGGGMQKPLKSDGEKRQRGNDKKRSIEKTGKIFEFPDAETKLENVLPGNHRNCHIIENSD